MHLHSLPNNQVMPAVEGTELEFEFFSDSDQPVPMSDSESNASNSKTKPVHSKVDQGMGKLGKEPTTTQTAVSDDLDNLKYILTIYCTS